MRIGPDDCPPTPPVKAGVCAAIVHEACETVGGLGKLASMVGVAPAALERWATGIELPPERVLRACIDIVLLHERRGE